MWFSGTRGNHAEETRGGKLLCHIATCLLYYSSLSVLSGSSLCPLIKPPQAQSLPHAGALEAWETHISHILFQNIPHFSDAHLQPPHMHCTPRQCIGQPKLNSFKSPSFLPISFPALGDCKVKSVPKCHQFPSLTSPPKCMFSKMMPWNTMALQPFIQQLMKSLETWLWTKESMETTTTRDMKSPNPVNWPHCQGPLTPLPRRAKGNGCSLNGLQ